MFNDLIKLLSADIPLFRMTGELLLDCLFIAELVWSVSSQDEVDDPDSSSVDSDGGWSGNLAWNKDSNDIKCCRR